MRTLLDTHIVLWAIADSGKLPPKARSLLLETGDFYVSIVSVWEVALKHFSHPDRISMSEVDYVRNCRLLGFDLLPIETGHVFALRTLRRPESAPRHQDPFDRMMIAQAKAEGMAFLTHDSLLSHYGEECVLYL